MDLVLYKHEDLDICCTKVADRRDRVGQDVSESSPEFLPLPYIGAHE